MRILLFFLIVLSGCTRHIVRENPRIYTSANPAPVYVPKYEVGRAVLPFMLGTMGGVMYTGSTKGKIVQQGLFFGAAISIGAWPKRPVKFHLIDLGFGIGGAALGFAIKNQIERN